MTNTACGSPTPQQNPAAGFAILIVSEWSSRFQQFLTERRIPSFVNVAGVRVQGRLCDELSLGRSLDRDRIDAALADWALAFPGGR